MPSRRRSRRRRKSRARLTLYLALVCVTVLAVIGLSHVFRAGSVASERPVQAGASEIVLQFNAPLGPRFAGEIVAESAGLFRAANIAVTLKPGQSDDDVIAAVADGRALVGVVDPISFLKARASGKPVVAFAADFVENATIFFALEKSKIHAPEDFINQRVGRLNGTYPAIFYDSLLNMRGIARSDVREIGTDVNVAGLVSGAVDVIPGRIGVEDVALKESGAGYSTVRLFDFGIHVPDLIYIAAEKTVRDRPSVLTRLLEGVIAGWQKTYADVADASRVMAERSDGALPVEQAAFVLSAQRDLVITIGRRVMEFDEIQWKQLVRMMIGARQLDEYFDLSRAVNYAIVKDAHRRPLSYGNAARPEPVSAVGR